MIEINRILNQICWTPIILYDKYYTRNLNQTMKKDRLKLGIKKYGYDSEFIREYNSLMLQLKYDEREKFFDKWKIDKVSTGK